MKLIERLHGEGQTVVVVTHDREVAAHAHRIIHIRDGKVERDERLR